MFSVAGGMEALLSLVVLASFISVSVSIRCLCSDTKYCVLDAVTEEECPDRLSVEYIRRNFDATSEDLRKPMLLLMQSRQTAPSAQGTNLSDKIESALDMNSKVELLLAAMTPETLLASLESMQQLSDYGFGIDTKGETPNEEALAKINALLSGKAQRVEQNTLALQYCVKLIDLDGNQKRGCGVVGISMLGHELADGCHMLVVAYQGVVDYCKCDSDLCNAGNITLSEKEDTTINGSKNIATMPIAIIFHLLIVQFLRV
jgi:hypothetical protein